jgi:hypothetical protein
MIDAGSSRPLKAEVTHGYSNTLEIIQLVDQQLVAVRGA